MRRRPASLAWFVSLLLVGAFAGPGQHRHESARDACTATQFPTNDPVADYIQVGYGAAGAFGAKYLMDGINCTSSLHIFEAGSDVRNELSVMLPLLTGADLNFTTLTVRPGFNVHTDWNYRCAAANAGLFPTNTTASYPRAHAIGGCTSHHAMVYFRPTDGDLERWAQLSENARWLPHNVLPVLKAMENNTYYGTSDPAFHGASGPISVARNGYSSYPYTDRSVLALFDVATNAFNIKKTGVNGTLDPNGDQRYRVGVGYWQRTVFASDRGYPLAGRRSYPGNTLYDSLLARCPAGKVNFHLNTQVTRIIMDGTRAVGIEYVEGGDNYAVDPRYNATATDALPRKIMYARRGVILAAGTFNSVQLVELSGIGSRRILENLEIPIVKELVGVGENMQDHPEMSMIFEQAPFNLSDPALANTSTFLDSLRVEGCRPDLLSTCAGDLTQCQDPCLVKWAVHGAGPYTSNLVPAGLDWFSGAFGANRDAYGDCHLHYIAGAYFNGWDEPTGINPFQLTMLAEIHKMEGRGRCHIRTRNATAPPVVEPGFMQNTRDLQRLVNCSLLARSIATHPWFQTKWNFTAITERAATASRQTFADWLPYLAEHVYGHHGTSTLMMGSRRDPMSVTDAYGRIWGTQNLYVIDLSTSAEITDGNPQGQAFLLGSMGGKAIADLEMRAGASSSRTVCGTADANWIYRTPVFDEATDCPPISIA